MDTNVLINKYGENFYLMGVDTQIDRETILFLSHTMKQKKSSVFPLSSTGDDLEIGSFTFCQ